METGKVPELFRAPRVEINDDVLKAVSASGIKYMVKESITLPYLKDQEAANAFVQTLQPGAILAIKTGEPVYQKVDAPTKTDETPAYDKQPTVKDMSGQSKEERTPLIKQLEYFFIALDNQKIKTDYVSNFRKIKYVRGE